MDIDNNKQVAMFFQKIGKEVWEQGELSPGSKAILRSISVQNIRRYREQFQQMAFQQLRQRANNPAQQELLDAITNCAQVFSNDSDRFIKECLKAMLSLWLFTNWIKWKPKFRRNAKQDD